MGRPGTSDGQFVNTGLVVDSSDNIYVADRGNNRVQKFDSNGTLLQNGEHQEQAKDNSSLPAVRSLILQEIY